MLWVGGGQGAGKTTLAWHLSRASDVPVHRIDLWTYDHAERMPATETLDEQLTRGAAAADAFEAHSRSRQAAYLPVRLRVRPRRLRRDLDGHARRVRGQAEPADCPRVRYAAC
jgi:hypothetical protein